MKAFAAKSDLNFQPRANVNIGAVGVNYTTPTDYRRTLGGLALINGVKGTLRYQFERSGGAATATVTLTVKTLNGAQIATKSVNLPVSAVTTGTLEMDFGGISGASPFYCEIDVTAADAGTVATFDAVADCETPVVIGGC